MRAATRPACSWAEPSSGETEETSWVWNVSGSAPYFRTLASLVDWAWVNGFVLGPLIWP